MKLMRLALLCFSGWQASAIVEEQVERNRKYKMAKEAAAQSGKPLLVIGGPWGGEVGFPNPIRWIMHFRAHGCGDYCLDLNPTACQGCPNFLQADIRDIPLPAGSMGSALASHILEHLFTIDDAVMALNELYRVADSVFIASPNKRDIFNWIHPGHHLWIQQKEDTGEVIIEQRRNNGLPT